MKVNKRYDEMEPVYFGVVGVGGYASMHIYAVETMEEENLGKLSAVVVRNPNNYRDVVADLRKKDVTIYENYEDMLKGEAGRVEIVTLPTPIHQHKDMTISALKAGFNVVVEKPPAVTIQDINEMIEAEKRSAGFCAVGFQSQSESVVRILKDLICEGRLGRISEVVVKGRWKRLDSYYERNVWGGKLVYNGKYVLDGTVCNALSHYLMNALYFASVKRRNAAKPERVRAELYRGHEIEGEDTSCLEIDVENGAKVFFFATLCGLENENPVHEVTGSKGRARWAVGEDARIEYCDGHVEVVSNEGVDEKIEVFRNAARYLRGLDKELNCPLSLTKPFVLTLNGTYESAKIIRNIPSQCLTFRSEEDSIATTIKDIIEIIDSASERRKLYSDLGVEWAHPTDYFSLTDYKSFNMKL